MIKAIRCDQASFQDIQFHEGLNVVLADRVDTSTEKDLRNGLGKSTLIEIIHFCLGGKARKDGGIFSVKVMGWSYTLDMIIQGRELTVSRNTEKPHTVTVTSSFNYEDASVIDEGVSEKVLSISAWNDFLGKVLFDLYPDDLRLYQPTFRSLISYLIRAGKDSYSTPFEQHRKQLEWDKQINNAFLLGLAWEDASDLQLLRDEKAEVDLRTRLLTTQIKGNPRKLLGVLEANRVQLQQKLYQEEQSLVTFRVHPQYQSITSSVDRLTEEIHGLVNANVADSQIIDLYNSSADEDDSDMSSLLRTYEEAGVIFPTTVMRKLEDVKEFHLQVVRNRKNFLASEIERLQRLIDIRTREIEVKNDFPRIYDADFGDHGALEEYTRLQKLHVDALTSLHILDSQINDIRSLEQRKSQLRIETEQLQQRMRDDYDERSVQRQRAIASFNSNSEMIYDVQGTLIINVTESGFKFDVIIKRDGSDGIGNMKIFCYDLMLAELWANKTKSPRFLIHDSIIFDGVDERQVKNALELAANASADQEFQYICTLNSDNVPWHEFSRLRLPKICLPYFER